MSNNPMLTNPANQIRAAFMSNGKPTLLVISFCALVLFSSVCSLHAQDETQPEKQTQKADAEPEPIGSKTVGLLNHPDPIFSRVRSWEFSPYKIRIWTHFGDHPNLNETLYETIVRETTYDAELVDKSGWRLWFEKAPRQYLPMIDLGIPEIELTDEMKQSDDIALSDCIAFLGVKYQDGIYSITARQLDCTTQLFGPTASYETRYISRVPNLIFHALRNTLVPIAKIERIEGEFVRLRVRATHVMKKIDDTNMLVDNTDSPGWVSMKSIFRPIIRRNNKNGRIAEKEGIRVVDWTFLRPSEIVRNPIVPEQYYIKAEVHGAKRAPLAGRTSRSQKKYALVVRPTKTTTTLKIVTKVRAPKIPKPVPDKKIFVRYPGQPKGDKSVELGHTDKDGQIKVVADKAPLHLIYIKSGERRILARLPIVPGYFDALEAPLRDDKFRLRAEGILAGLEFSFMDMVVQREIFSMRIRSSLEKKKASIARGLYNRFITEIESPEDFRNRMNKEKGELIKAVPDEDTKQTDLINAMFAQLQDLLNKKTVGDLGLTLDKEIANVENGGTYKPKDTGNIGELPENLKEKS